MIIPELGVEFDFILAYSVFTHIAREEMHDLVGQLRALPLPCGTLALTFLDPHHSSWPATYAGDNLRNGDQNRPVERKPPSMSPAFSNKARGAAWCALVDGTELHVESDGIDGLRQLMTYHVFYAAEFLQQEFPNAKILPPVRSEMQGCCLLRRAASAP